MRYIILLLIVACVAVQYPLRFGELGYDRIGHLEQEIRDLKDHNQALDVRNHAMEAEIADLKQEGSEAMEEKARRELNLVKENETLVRVLYPISDTISASSARRPESPAGQPAGASAKPVNQTQPSAKPAQQAANKPASPKTGVSAAGTSSAVKPQQQAGSPAPDSTSAAQSAQQQSPGSLQNTLKASSQNKPAAKPEGRINNNSSN